MLYLGNENTQSNERENHTYSIKFSNFQLLIQKGDDFCFTYFDFNVQNVLLWACPILIKGKKKNSSNIKL